MAIVDGGTGATAARATSSPEQSSPADRARRRRGLRWSRRAAEPGAMPSCRLRNEFGSSPAMKPQSGDQHPAPAYPSGPSAATGRDPRRSAMCRRSGTRRRSPAPSRRNRAPSCWRQAAASATKRAPPIERPRRIGATAARPATWPEQAPASTNDTVTSNRARHRIEAGRGHRSNPVSLRFWKSRTSPGIARAAGTHCRQLTSLAGVYGDLRRAGSPARTDTCGAARARRSAKGKRRTSHAGRRSERVNTSWSMARMRRHVVPVG